MNYTMIMISVLAGGLSTASAQPPKGWFVAGSHPREYQASIDRETVRSGKASAHFESAVLKTGGFGTLMQQFKVGDFRGKRVRLSGYVRAQDVQAWAGLWMRVDGAGGEALSFDNMQERPIKGTADWKKYEIVLDVPEKAEEIAYGLLLTGRGDTWLDDLKFDVVGKDTPVTGQSSGKKLPAEPVNLDFEQH
jgi:hypothetical protein